MINKNKKGFVLAETIIATSIVSIFLITSFSFTYMTIKKYEVRQRYNQIDSVYALNSVKMFLYRFTNLNDMLDDLIDNNYIDLSTDYILNKVNIQNDKYKIVQYFNTLKENINLEELYITQYNNPSSITTNDAEFKDFLKTKDLSYNVGNEYKLVGKFKKNNEDIYTIIKIHRPE